MPIILIVVCVVAFLIFVVHWAIDMFVPAEAEEKYCPSCGNVAAPKSVTPGSVLLEIMLWLFALLPGLIYSIWRRSQQRIVCPHCSNIGMVPLDSPRARAALSR